MPRPADETRTIDDSDSRGRHGGPAPKAPARLGRYEILGLLGQGGMGSVFKAHDPVIERFVAVKLVGALAQSTQGALDRFRREAQAAGKLSHPNVVSVYDMGVDDATGTPFIVMEYVDGVSLAVVLRENALIPFDQALEILEQVAAALVEAHEHGIIHRDIKPANVFLDARGRVKVGDFGIARVAGSDLTQSGVALGTPGFVAPEVLKGAPADARSDVFALGALAYQLLTGRRPFDGPTPTAMALAVVHHVPEPPSRARPEIPCRVSNLVLRSLDKSPEARPASAAEFLREIRAGAPESGVPVVARRTSAGSRFALAAAAVVALSLGLVSLLVLRECRAATPATVSPAAVAPVVPASAAPTRGPRPTAAAPRAGAGTDGSNPTAAVPEWRREADKRAQERAREEAKKRGDKSRGARKKSAGNRRGDDRRKD